MTDNKEYDQMVNSINKNPKFMVMVRKKQRFSLLLLSLTLGLYILLILIIGFAPQIISKPLAPGMTTTWGIPAGFFLIVWTVILTAYYIHKNNQVFDPLNDELIEEAAHETLV